MVHGIAFASELVAVAVFVATIVCRVIGPELCVSDFETPHPERFVYLYDCLGQFVRMPVATHDEGTCRNFHQFQSNTVTQRDAFLKVT